MLRLIINNLLFALFTTCIVVPFAAAQPGVFTYGEDEREALIEGAVLPNDGALIVGWREGTTSLSSSGLIIAFDAFGTPIFEREVFGSGALKLTAIDGSKSQGWMAFGTNDQTGVAYRIASDATVLDSFEFAEDQLLGIEQVIVNGSNAYWLGTDLMGGPLLGSITSDGILNWTTSPAATNETLQGGVGLTQLSDGTFLVLSNKRTGGAFTDFRPVVIQLDSAGDEIDRIELNLAGKNVEAHSIGVVGDSIYVIAEARTNPTYDQNELIVFLLDENLNLGATKSNQLNHHFVGRELLANELGWTVIGYEGDPAMGNRNGALIQLNSQWTLVSEQLFGGSQDDLLFSGFSRRSGIWAVGSSQSNGRGPADGFLLLSNLNGAVPAYPVSGTLRNTINCSNTGDSLANWFVIAAQDGLIYYTQTDANGHYNFQLDSGAATISVIPPAAVWSTCLPDTTILLNQSNQTSVLDLGVFPNEDCPELAVDFSSFTLPSCDTAVLTLTVRNIGSAAAINSIARVRFDPQLTVLSSDLTPVALGGNRYDFALPNIAAQTEFTADFTVFVACDGELEGTLMCNSVTAITPGVCQSVTSNWDGSDLNINTTCQGDSVEIAIQNIGAQAMSIATNYIITEDEIMLRFGALQLSAGQDTTFTVFSGGATISIYVEETGGNPQSQNEIVTVEGCGGVPQIGNSPVFPYLSSTPSHVQTCSEVLGNNRSQSLRADVRGFGTDRAIALETPVEFTVDFINQASETADYLVIAVEIPIGFDPRSFSVTATSHPHLIKWSSTRTVRFEFENLNFASANAPISQRSGFVQFALTVGSAVPLGTQLETQASLAFGLDTMQQLTPLLHTVGLPDWITVSTNEKVTTKNQMKLILFPNPVVGAALMVRQSTGSFSQNGDWKLRSANGTLLQNGIVPAGQQTFSIDLADLPKGVYSLEVKTKQFAEIQRFVKH